MRVESYVVVEMLQRLEQQGAAIRPNAVGIAANLNKDTRDQYSAARDASAELKRALDAFVMTTELLECHVVAHDGMGELGESLGELMLRARGVVLDAELSRLCAAFGDPAVAARARLWFAGRCQSIVQVAAYARERLAKINTMWIQYRRDQPPLPGMTDEDRATLYPLMIRIAQRAQRELWKEPEFARVLENGLAAIDLPEVHLACKQIVTVVGLETKPRRGRTLNEPAEGR